MNTPNNVDINELEKFSSIADEWWNENGSFKTLHDINPIRLNYVKDCISLDGIKVLDIGCGGGILSEALAKEGAIVTGLDAAEENISIASKHAEVNSLDIQYVTDTAESYAETHNKRYDLITCMELLEHVPDPELLIKACATMIKPGGHVIFSTINRNMKAYLLAVLAGEYLLRLLPKGTHQYEKFIRPSELVNWCQSYGLVTNDISGLHYNPILKQCALDKNPDVNYIIATTSL